MRRILLALLLSSLSISASAQDGLKIYISADMEGLTGVVTGEQLGPSGFEYARFRQIMTDEVNTVIDAAREAGATDFLVSDSHGNGQNLLIEQLPDDVMIVRAWPRALGMMHGIDDTFDGAILVGYHASTSNTEGVRAHTNSSANVTELKLNGVQMTEGAWNAAVAGHFGVPIILVTGGDAAVAEVQSVVGNIEGAVVKFSNGFHSATTMTPAAGLEVIRAATTRAIKRIDEFETYDIEGSPVIELSLKNYLPIEYLGYLRDVDRIASHTVRYEAMDMIDAAKWLRFVLGYSASITP